MLQFATRGLNLNNKPDVISEIYTEITKLVAVSDVVGVQLIPKHWPHRVEILCANQRSKVILQEKGLSIQSKRIDLSEPGLGKVKVSVDDAPMDLSNDMIREVLSVYGEFLDVRNDYLHVGGNRVPWWNGTRHVDMCNLKSEIPPTLKVRHGQNDIKIKLWHLGQTHIECRWCKNHIVKENHDCPRKPQRRCFNCGSTSHIKSECPTGKQCFNCGESSHIARECPNGHWDISDKDHFPHVSRPEKSRESPSKSEAEQNQDFGPPCSDSPQTRAIDIEDSAGRQTSIDCLLIGSSNCRNLVIPEKDFETHYMEYVENLTELSTRCPKAEILISSVLPRNESLTTKSNRQIRLFNDKLKTLAEGEACITFVDNWSYLADGDQVQSSFYRKNDRIHLNTSGKARLAEMLLRALRETVYRNKLENEWQIHVTRPALQ